MPPEGDDMLKRYRVRYDLYVKRDRRSHAMFVDVIAGGPGGAAEEFADFVYPHTVSNGRTEVRNVRYDQLFRYEVTYRVTTPEGPVTSTETAWGISDREVAVEVQASVKDQFRGRTVKLLNISKMGAH